MASRERWKRTERRIALELGGERVPVTGRGRGDQPDITHPSLSIEVKTRETLPGWLVDAMAQATASATDDQTPIVVLHQVGTRYDAALVVLELANFRALVATASRTGTGAKHLDHAANGPMPEMLASSGWTPEGQAFIDAIAEQGSAALAALFPDDG
jgi:hypothetical protein